MKATYFMMTFVILGVLWNSGCGAGAAQSTTPAAAPPVAEESASQIESPDDIATLQATIEEQRGVMAGLTQCIDRCRAAESICDSAGRICDIARDLAELEAIQSCQRAESSCSEARDLTNEDCDCP